MIDELKFNLLNESKISHTKLQMRDKNQMMARVQRQEDCIYNNKLNSENKITEFIKLDSEKPSLDFQLPSDNLTRIKTRFLIGKRGNR